MNINLNNQWTVYWTQTDLAFSEFQDQKNEIPSTLCSIPNQFVRILQETQHLPDPYIDTNYETYLEYEHHHIWFEYNFDLDNEQIAELNSEQASPQEKIINLIFDGIDTISEIFFNNESIGHSDNMFIQWKFRITHLLQAVNNSLVVHILPLPPENKTTDPNLAITVKGWAIRKPQHMFGWDILPRILSGGLFQPIRILSESIPEINSIWIETIDVQGDIASLRVGISLSPLDHVLLESNNLLIDLNPLRLLKFMIKWNLVQ
jgi:beta-mannosidase